MKATDHLDTTSFHHPLINSQPQPLPADDPTPPYVIDLPPYPPPDTHLLLRKPCRRCLACLAISLLCLVSTSYLLWPSDPDLSIARLGLDRLRFHTDPLISIDLTMDVTVKVWNTAFYSMDYDCMLVTVGYRGERLGFATSVGGHVGRRRFSNVNVTLRLDQVEILSDVALLIEDLEKGVVTLDTETEIWGKLGIFAIDLPLKAKLKCEVMVDTENQRIYQQTCYPEVMEVI